MRRHRSLKISSLEKKITSTPLLEFLSNKKMERREERRKKDLERKRQRDEERNRKKIQVVKAIHPSIREQVIVHWQFLMLSIFYLFFFSSGRKRNNCANY